MGTYCNECSRKVTSAERPISCNCGGDGYCYTCRDENENGKISYVPIEAFDINGKKIMNCYKKVIDEWACGDCGVVLEFAD